VTKIVLAEPNFLRRYALQGLLQELGADVVAVAGVEDAIPELVQHSGRLMLDGTVDGSANVEGRTLRRLQRMADLQVILVVWNRKELAEWTTHLGVVAVVDLSSEEDDVRAALQRLATEDAAGWPTVESASELSPRELSVLRGVEAGRSNREMAYELGLSITTIGLLRAALQHRQRERSQQGPGEV
jgi:DNA-binding NarL/FixJ family response regulator